MKRLLLAGLVLFLVASQARAEPPRGPVNAPPAEQGRSLALREPAWRGPRVKLSYRLLTLRDDLGSRRLQSAGFAGFLPTRALRAGGGVDVGVRNIEDGPADGFLSGSLFAGYQLLSRIEPAVPYVVAVGEIGLVFGKRFHTPISHGIRGAGVELGCDLRVIHGLAASVGALFMMYTMDGLAYPSWGLRISLGL
jgi:hypothetical protein